MEHIARLFGEAWDRQRQRHRKLAWFGLAICGVAVLAYAMFRPGSAAAPATSVPGPAGALAESPAVVFSQAPYMGVRCRVANWIGCDAVGLAIWLKHPADLVTASIDGRPLAVDRRGDQPIAATRRGTEFDGYLRPAGIESSMHVRPVPGTSTWYGNPATSASVRLLIDYGRGRYVTTHLQVPLEAGWG